MHIPVHHQAQAAVNVELLLIAYTARKQIRQQFGNWTPCVTHDRSQKHTGAAASSSGCQRLWRCQQQVLPKLTARMLATQNGASDTFATTHTHAMPNCKPARCHPDSMMHGKCVRQQTTSSWWQHADPQARHNSPSPHAARTCCCF
jgi:hypothetical protein